MEKYNIIEFLEGELNLSPLASKSSSTGRQYIICGHKYFVSNRGFFRRFSDGKEGWGIVELSRIENLNVSHINLEKYKIYTQPADIDENSKKLPNIPKIAYFDIEEGKEQRYMNVAADLIFQKISNERGLNFNLIREFCLQNLYTSQQNDLKNKVEQNYLHSLFSAYSNENTMNLDIGNLCFRMTDENGETIGYEIRNLETKYKGNIGEKGLCWFSTTTNSNKFFLFESCFDLLAFREIHKANAEYQGIYISLSGQPGLGQIKMLNALTKKYENATIYSCFDNDEAGHSFANIVQNGVKNVTHEKIVPQNSKDWNEELNQQQKELNFKKDDNDYFFGL